MSIRVCSKCDLPKSLEEDFYKRATYKDGYARMCKVCCRKQIGEWQRSHPEATKAISKRHLMKSTYGLSDSQYKALKRKQKNLCALCGNPETSVYRGKVRELAVDHNHLTGKVRALLCTNCNTALGKLKDSVYLLKKAIAYLIKNR
jgi:hypothetical protein